MPKGKIGPRQSFTGTGMQNSPEHLAELEERRTLHARLIQGKPEKTFSEFLEEKMRDDDDEGEEESDELPAKGVKDPHLGLSVGQSPDLAKSGKGRRAGRVIIKG
ncbi:MAG: hypothetical protein VYC39_11370 [Myxococcota bacterium]|nr:hypothetical protein [Myxococcota bacterium]